MAYNSKGFNYGLLDRDLDSIEFYNQVIDKFKDFNSFRLLNQVKMALINKFEINLVLNKQNLQEEIDLYLGIVQQNKNDLAKYKMLELLNKAKNSNQDELLQQWEVEFEHIYLSWSFGSITKLAKKIRW